MEFHEPERNIPDADTDIRRLTLTYVCPAKGVTITLNRPSIISRVFSIATEQYGRQWPYIKCQACDGTHYIAKGC